VGCLSPPDTAPAPLLLSLLSPSLLSLPLVTLLLLLRTKPPLLARISLGGAAGLVVRLLPAKTPPRT
jgi:hypothetical protein